MVRNVLEMNILRPYPSGERWDQELSPAAARRLSPAEKRQRSVVALHRKIAIVVAASKSNNASRNEPYVPSSRKELREWHDASRGLWSWTDVKLDNPDLKNGAVMTEFCDAVAEIGEVRKEKQSTLQNKIASKDAIIESLENQIARLLEENKELRLKLYGPPR